MARCLKGEASLEDEHMLAEMLLQQEDLEKEYEIFRALFQAHSTYAAGDDARKRFEKITHKLRRENLL